MTPEQSLWHNRLRPTLDRVRGLAYDRLENRVSAGVPDVVYSYRGTGWIENKVSTSTSTGRIGLSGWRQSQRNWTARHVECGARVFLCVACPDAVFLIRAADTMDECPIWMHQTIERCHPSVVARWPDRIDALELAHYLGGGT